MIDKKLKADILESRKEHFKIEVKVRFPLSYEDEFQLFITHNGNQWQGLSLLPDEARQIIKALSDYLETE